MTINAPRNGSTAATNQNRIAAVAPQARYWARTRRFTLALALVWFALTFAMVFYARELSQLTFFGWPFSYYMAAQGGMLAYLGIVGLHAWIMRRFDRRYASEARDEA